MRASVARPQDGPNTGSVHRLPIVETKTIEGGSTIGTPVDKIRYQLGNHLGSAVVEVTETGAVISYEETCPYGSSTYRSASGSIDVSSRRYRYNGKERDEETGLHYYGARYLAAWLGRWTSADPLGIGADGPGLYNYTRGSPVNYTDPSGTQSNDPAPAARVWRDDSPPPGGKSYPRQSLSGTGKAGTGPTASANANGVAAKPDPFQMAARVHGATEAELLTLTVEWNEAARAAEVAAKSGGSAPPAQFWKFQLWTASGASAAADEKLAQLDAYVEAGLAKKVDGHYRSTVRDQAEAAGWLGGDKAAKFDRIAEQNFSGEVRGWALGRAAELGLALWGGRGNRRPVCEGTSSEGCCRCWG